MSNASLSKSLAFLTAFDGFFDSSPLLRKHVLYLELTSLGSTSGAGGIGISRRSEQFCKKILSRLWVIFNESSSGMSNPSLSKSLACSSFFGLKKKK